MRKSRVHWCDLLIRFLFRHPAGVSEGFCRNAAPCESLGHRPRKQAILSRKALNGRKQDTILSPRWGLRHSFRIFPGRCPGLSHCVPLALNTWRLVLIVLPWSGSLLRSCRKQNRDNSITIVNPTFARPRVGPGTTGPAGWRRKAAACCRSPGRKHNSLFRSRHFKNHGTRRFALGRLSLSTF